MTPRKMEKVDKVEKLALFDLDHTLIPIDSDHAWGEFTIGLGWVDGPDFKRQNDAFYEQYKVGTLDVYAYMRFATAAICRQGEKNALAAHAAFMQQVVNPAIGAPALDLLRQHQQDGDAVVIVTATNEFVTRPIAAALGVTELIAVELERDISPGGNGWYTGAIRGTASFREGKVTRVDEWLQTHGLDWNTVQTTFYSDSLNDLPLLEKVNVPIATNPEPGLRALAIKRGWRILELFGTP